MKRKKQRKKECAWDVNNKILKCDHYKTRYRHRDKKKYILYRNLKVPKAI